MSKLVKDLFRHKDKPGVIGMELEVEALQPLSKPLKSNIWLMKDDGSLRNIGYEFYTRNPIHNDHLLSSRIEELVDFLRDKDFRIDYDSTRTSFHVHVSMLNHTMRQVWNQVFSYWLLEKPLMNLCGKSRCGNMFCLRACDAEAMVLKVDKIVNSPTFKPVVFDTDNLRYSSQNLKALATFGSIEYRGMRGTHDPKLLYSWASGLQEMSERTRTFSSPVEAMNYYDNRGPRAFVEYVLPNRLGDMVLSQDGFEKDMSDGFDIIFDTVYNTDWDDADKAIDNYWDRKNSTRHEEGVMVSDPFINTSNWVTLARTASEAGMVVNPTWTTADFNRITPVDTVPLDPQVVRTARPPRGR